MLLSKRTGCFISYSEVEGKVFLMRHSIELMTNRICAILQDCAPSIYLYGSVVLNDFRLGWSDIDILVLTQVQISERQAEDLVGLRQRLLEEAPDNLYFRSIEGGMLTLSSFVSGQKDRVVYWGTSGQRITDTYHFDSFSLAELLENGVLLAGEDIRRYLTPPTIEDLRAGVERHYYTIRQYAQKTGRSLYSFGWLLDIARCIYTLRTGKVIAKTFAGEWALRENLCPVPQSLQAAINVRYAPSLLKDNPALQEYAETLGSDIQSFADVLECELGLLNNGEKCFA